MKFSASVALAVFGITSHVFAAPPAMKRDATTVQILQADITYLTAQIDADLGEITTAVQKSSGDATAQVALIATLNLALNSIVENFLAATQEVVSATKGAPTNLNPVDLSTLSGVLQATEQLIANIEVTLQNSLSTLVQDTQAALNKELIAVGNAITSLQAPLAYYAQQVQQSIGSTSAGATGIGNLLSSIGVAINSLLINLGLGTATSNPTGIISGAGGATSLLSGAGGATSILSGAGGATGLLSGAAGGLRIAGPTGLLLGGGANPLSGVTEGITEGAGGSGILGHLGINILKRGLPVPVTVPGLPTLPTGLIGEILAQIEVVLETLLAGTSLPVPTKRGLLDIPDLPVALPTGSLPTALVAEIVAQVEAILEKLLGGTSLPVPTKS